MLALSGPWPSKKRRMCRNDICERVVSRGLRPYSMRSNQTYGFPSGPNTTPLGNAFFCSSPLSRCCCSLAASKGCAGIPVVICTAHKNRERIGNWISVMGIAPSRPEESNNQLLLSCAPALSRSRRPSVLFASRSRVSPDLDRDEVKAAIRRLCGRSRRRGEIILQGSFCA